MSTRGGGAGALAGAAFGRRLAGGWPADNRHDFVAAEILMPAASLRALDWGVCATVIGQMGIRDRLVRLGSVARAQDPGVTRVRRLAPSAGRPGGCHARSTTVAIV
jgi:hypothetical protein